ncbi:MAG: permease-like cell division protein FtsX [Myxococcales bacterium]
MTRLFYFLRAAFSGLRQSPFVHLVAALTIGVAMFSVGLARFGSRAADRVLETWGSGVEVSVYLADGLPLDDAKALAAQIQKEDGGEVRLVMPDEALARLRKDLGESGEVLENLPKNPLPASLEVRPAPLQRSAGAIAALAQKWKKLAGVASVEYGREWVERLEMLGRAVRGAGALILLIVLIAAVTVVAATLQLAIYARREEIEIQKLVGATDSFVKAPFLLEGVLQGVLGAGIGVGGLYAVARYLGPVVGQAVAFAIEGLSFPALIDPRGAAELFGAGAALGLVGSLLAVRRFLRV